MDRTRTADGCLVQLGHLPRILEDDVVTGDNGVEYRGLASLRIVDIMKGNFGSMQVGVMTGGGSTRRLKAYFSRLPKVMG